MKHYLVKKTLLTTNVEHLLLGSFDGASAFEKILKASEGKLGKFRNLSDKHKSTCLPDTLSQNNKEWAEKQV